MNAEEGGLLMVIGTCNDCGGPVETPDIWMGVQAPPKKCSRCGAEPTEPYGAVLRMKKEQSK